MDINEAASAIDPVQITQQLHKEQTRIFRRLAEISYRSPETSQLLQRLAQISEEDPDDSTDSSSSGSSSDPDARQQARRRAYRRPGQIPILCKETAATATTSARRRLVTHSTSIFFTTIVSGVKQTDPRPTNLRKKGKALLDSTWAPNLREIEIGSPRETTTRKLADPFQVKQLLRPEQTSDAHY